MRTTPASTIGSASRVERDGRSPRRSHAKKPTMMTWRLPRTVASPAPTASIAWCQNMRSPVKATPATAAMAGPRVAATDRSGAFPVRDENEQRQPEERPVERPGRRARPPRAGRRRPRTRCTWRRAGPRSGVAGRTSRAARAPRSGVQLAGEVLQPAESTWRVTTRWPSPSRRRSGARRRCSRRSTARTRRPPRGRPGGPSRTRPRSDGMTSSIVVAGAAAAGRSRRRRPRSGGCPARPPDRTADSAGSTATRWIAGERARSARVTPRKQPPCRRRCRTRRCRPSSWLEQLLADGPVAVDHVGVVELVGRRTRRSRRRSRRPGRASRGISVGRDARRDSGSARPRRRTPASSGSSPRRRRPSCTIRSG